MARNTRVVSCSGCFKTTEISKTAMIEGKRVCSDCKAEYYKKYKSF